MTFGGTPSAAIYYPKGKAGERFPFISYAHGTGAGREGGALKVYRTLLTTIASAGFVVVATDTCPTKECYARFALDQVATIKACREDPGLHPALATADFGRVGVAGHSMGGMSTISAAGGGRGQGNSSSTAPLIDPKEYNISVAVSQHPCHAPAAGVTIPIMFTAGTSDAICPDSNSKNAFGELGSEVPRVLFDIVGNGHFDPTDDPREPPSARANSEDAAVALFFSCWLRGEDCGKVYGASGDAICTALPSKKKASPCTVAGSKPPSPRVA